MIMIGKDIQKLQDLINTLEKTKKEEENKKESETTINDNVINSVNTNITDKNSIIE